MSDQAALDRMAKQAGFPDYATMLAWQRNRSAALRGSNTTTQEAPVNNALPRTAPPPQEDQRSWYQRLLQALGG